jgi:hypothetical protein
MLSGRQHGFLFPRAAFYGGVLGLLLLRLVISAASTAENADVNKIVLNSVEATKRDWAAAPKFECLETDKAGNASKTFEDRMILGSPYEVLVAVDGKPLSRAAQADQARKLQRTIAEREHESPEEREQRIARYRADRERDHLLMQELTEAFRFTMRGEAQLEGRKVYVLQATPLPGYVPPSLKAQVLKGMQGTMWIDQQTFQWVKVEAEVVHPVSIEGFLARVEPGTRFELEKMPVSDDVWLPKHFSMKSHAKVLFFIHHQQQEDETYFNYHPAGSAVPGRHPE